MALRARLLLIVFLGCAGPVRAQDALTVLAAQPQGEIASLQEAAEIRVRFSEPMVAIGRIPDQVTAPFFSVTPAIAGAFRWAGPTLLVFTPDVAAPLPFATTYAVTIAASASAVSGRTLGRPYTFEFTTPTVRLLEADWYRLNGRFDQAAIITLRFNQPVNPAGIVAHVSARFVPHDWVPPDLSAEERTRMGRAAVAQFEAKVAETEAAARSQAPIGLRLATTWDTERFPEKPDLVVLQTMSVPPTESEIAIAIDSAVPSPAGPATPRGVTQGRTIALDHALFVYGFECRQECDGDRYNQARLSSYDVRLDSVARAASVKNITDRAREAAVARSAEPAPSEVEREETVEYFSLEDLGFDRQPPASTYAVTIDAGLQADDGQTLGYTWVGVVENWHARAFTSFGDGHGVWEASGGRLLPFYSRNLAEVRQWAQPIAPDQLMPTIRDLTAGQFRLAPSGDGVSRRLGGEADRTLSFGLDLAPALKSSPTGFVWAAVKRGEPIEHARVFDYVSDTTASVVQVTNLGITVKDSPQNTLVFVTRLDTGAPVADADVAIRRLDNTIAWSGRTDAQGIATTPQLRLRNVRQRWELAFLVTAAKDGDVAYVASDWNEGIEPYAFGIGMDPSEAQPILRGTAFTDRGVYRLGEDVHIKAILRRDTPTGIQLVPASTPVYVAVRDARYKVVNEQTLTANAWSSVEWTLTLPEGGSLGDYSIAASLEKSALDETPFDPDAMNAEDFQFPYRKIVQGQFLVAAYRRPDFRVDAALTGTTGLAGAPLSGVVTARYLFGAAMGNRPVTWTYSRSRLFSPPAAVVNSYPAERFVFVGCCDADEARDDDRTPILARAGALDAAGQLTLDLETRPSDGYPYQYTVEGDVEDVSRQHIAGSAGVDVHPAPWYVGLGRPSLFVSQRDGLSTTVIAVSPEGKPVPGVTVNLTLVQLQWHSVRRAEGNGFYTWDTERVETEVGQYRVTTAADPVPFAAPLPDGGAYYLRAVAEEAPYRSTTQLHFYAIGSGYTAWARYDHNRIDLVPERETYKPGDTARIMIQSPWEQATALLTVEREGIRSHRQFALTSTQQTVEVPIGEDDIPNVFVSVLLVKGRTAADTTEDTSDPGRPSFRMGYAKLAVEDASKRLRVSVKANSEEYRPAGTAKIDVHVNDARGAGVASEVTLWAVDYGVLSLTGFRTPDVLRSVYVPKTLLVMNEDSRQRIISRRALTPKGDDPGGGGGAEAGVDQLRKDFRVLAFWLGSVVTGANGHAQTDVKLPESLTTYRIMAVSGDKASRFGSGESDIRINKPVVLTPAFPRFMTRGDTAFFGSVVTSQLKSPGAATVTMRSLDPAILEITGAGSRSVQVPAGGSAEVRFDVTAKSIGRARVVTTVRLGGETDSYEDVVPVQIAVTPESVAAYGEAAPAATQTVDVPAGVVPGFGGLHLDLSSTALVGLAEGARYVVEYPYGCLEQKASRTFVLAEAAELGAAFALPGIDARNLRSEVQKSLGDLDRFQCPSGGFAFWPGACLSASPFLTSYALSVYQAAAKLNYAVSADVMERSYTYLEESLAQPPPANEGWWPAYTAWESFAVKVLAEGGRNQDSTINRLFTWLDRMPVFAHAYLADALAARGETGARPAELKRRIDNAILPEAGTSHVEELSDPYLLMFWNSNVRSTALVLGTLVRTGASQAEVSPLVRWLVAARKNGRWGNTQENALAMQALVDYYRKYESVVPNFTATVTLGTEDLVRAAFQGRTADVTARDVPLASLARGGAAPRELVFRREGEGTLFYAARLTYAPDAARLSALDAGFRVTRQYAPVVGDDTGEPASTFKAGDLVRVILRFDLPKERRYVAVEDPVPAGFEPVESWFVTTASDVARQAAEQQGADGAERTWQDIWRRGTFDHVERHDDRVRLFATRLSEGHHEFSYVVRATTAGTFVAAPTRAEEMYAPEVLGRTASGTIEVTR